MRLILMFDLPTNTSTDKKNYNTFKKHIVNLGFCMLQ
jgi:CRISPR-associated protein Cas2